MRKALKRTAMEPPPKRWLQTGDKFLNAVFGSPSKGLMYGKLYEVYGNESNGKTLLLSKLAAIAQRKNNAQIVWMDVEFSYDKEWMYRLGVDVNNVELLETYLDEKGELVSAQSLWKEAEKLCRKIYLEQNGRPIFLVCDSLATLLDSEELETEVDAYNMRTDMSTSKFIKRLTKRWVHLAYHYNVMLFFINQVRVKPNQFGNPEYAPGGKAKNFMFSVRVNLAATKGAYIISKGKRIGIHGVMANVKNKLGSGSRDGVRVGS